MRPAVERLIEQLASLGVPTPPVPQGHMTPQQAADVVAEASLLVDALGRGARGHGAPGADAASCCARSSRPTTTPATSVTPG